MSSPFQLARKHGYSDEEIINHLQSKPEYGEKIKKARQHGYSDQEISNFLSKSNQKPEQKPKNKQERSFLEKGARLGTQAALGLAENVALPYEIAVAPLASKEAQGLAYRQELGEDIENLLAQKQSGVWNEQDENLLQSLQQQMQSTNKADEFVKTADIGIKGLAEKATGADLHPEGILEKSTRWLSFIKNPTNIMQLAKVGLNPKEILKVIMPTGQEAFRGLGAGTALEMAEKGQFGPIGTLVSAIVGDVGGAGISGGIKGAMKFIANPKETLAKGIAKLTSKESLESQKKIIKDFQDAGLQADLGTLTNSDLVKWTQSRLAQSGFAGKELNELRQNLTSQIEGEYKNLSESLGELKYASSHEAGEVTRDALKKIRDTDLDEARKLYESANNSLKEGAYVDSSKILEKVNTLEKQLKPGQIKSSQQSAVLNILEKLKRDITDSTGKMMFSDVKDLINNKIALNDIINYEVQGGAKQLLKSVVGELDRAIISHGKENPSFARNYVNANRKFSEHAKTFRNRNVSNMLIASDPTKIIDKMKSVQGIRDLEKVLSTTQEGKEILKSLRSYKLEEVIGKNLKDSTTKQVQFGTFSKLLEKKNNRDIIREILDPVAFKRLEKLQKNAGYLADTMNKFYNASKSASTAIDAGIIAKGLGDIAHILSGNPWPLMRTVGTVASTRQLSKLLSDPVFLKLVEEAIISSKKNDTKKLMISFVKLRPYILQAMKEDKD